MGRKSTSRAQIMMLALALLLSVSLAYAASFSSPSINSASVEPLKVRPGDTMLVSANISDSYGISSVTADMGGVETINLDCREKENNGQDNDPALDEPRAGSKAQPNDEQWVPQIGYYCDVDIFKLIAGNVGVAQLGEGACLMSKWVPQAYAGSKGVLPENPAPDAKSSVREYTCSASWLVHDTLVKNYTTKITAKNALGKESYSFVNWSDPSGWYSTSWTYRRAITLSPATSVANYQVLVTLTAANFNYAQLSYPATGQDIRFTRSDGTTLQDYWIESWVNGGTSNIWVEVAASGTSTIYMYYGNPGATSASNGTNTFVLFDLSGATIANPSNYLTATSASNDTWTNLYNQNLPVGTYVSKPISTLYNYSYDFEYMLTGGSSFANNDAHVFFAGLQDAAGGVCSGNFIGAYLYYAPHCEGSGCPTRLDLVQNNSGSITAITLWSTGVGSMTNTLFYGRITRIGTNGTFYLYTDSARTTQFSGSPVSLTVTSAPMTYALPVSQTAGGGYDVPCTNGNNGGYNSGFIRNSRVRSYTSPEPSATVGSETSHTVSLTSASNNAANPIKGGSTFTITPSGQADSISDNLYFYCRLDVSGATSANTACSQGNTAYSSPYGTMTCTATAPSDTAAHTYYCNVYDALVYSSPERTTSITTDTSPPNTGTISVTSTGDAGYVNTATPVFSPSTTDVGTAGMGQMEFSCDGASWASPVTYATTYSSFNVKSGLNGCGTGDGARTVYVRFRDTLGNIQTTVANTGSFTVDTANPTFSFVSPTDANNSHIQSSRNWEYVNVSLTEQNKNAIILNWNGTNETLSCTGSAPNWVCGVNKTNLLLGTYNYYVWANDTAGNSNRTGTMTIYVQNITLTETLTPAIVNPSDSVTVSGQATLQPDGTNVASNAMNVFLDGTKLAFNFTPAGELQAAWPYRKALTINGSTTAQANYQVNLLLNSSNVGGNFNWSTYGNDTRFTWLNTTSNSEQNLSFWIEYWNNATAGNNASIWVKVPNVTASSVANTMVYMYYGNPNATYNNSLGGNNTFEFFDDFSGDLSKWTNNYPSAFTISIGRLMIAAGATGQSALNDFYSNSAFNPNTHAQDYDVMVSGTDPAPGGDLGEGWRIDGTTNNNIFHEIGAETVNSGQTGVTSGGIGFSFNTLNYGTSKDVWHKVTIKIEGTTLKIISDSSTYSGTDPKVNNHTSGQVGFIRWFNGPLVFYIDNLRVRKYASPEPSVLSVGAEQSAPVTNSTSGYNYNFTAPATAGTHTVKLNLTDANGIIGTNTTTFDVRTLVFDQFNLSDSAGRMNGILNPNQAYNITVRIQETNSTQNYTVSSGNFNVTVSGTKYPLYYTGSNSVWRTNTTALAASSSLGTQSFLANFTGTSGNGITGAQNGNNYTYYVKQLNITYSINDTAIYATESALINGTVYREPEHAASVNTSIQGTVNSGNLSISWWNTSWLYRKAITINGSTSNLSDYQIPINLTTALYNNTGLVASWHFSEGNGTTVADMSGNTNTGTLFGGATWTAGKFGNALYFDGINGRMNIPDTADTDFAASDSFTFEYWLKTNSTTTTQTIDFSVGVDGALPMINIYGPSDFNGKSFVRFRSSSGVGNEVVFSGNRVINDNIWHHFVIVRDVFTHTIYIYVDGTLDNSANDITTGGFDTVNKNLFYDAANGAYRGSGVLDELRIYKRALSADEIRQRYNNGSPKVRHDYQDIRFTNSSGTELPYWQETDSKFWVKADSIPNTTAGANIYMYYGNPGAVNQSNRAATFISATGGNIAYSGNYTIHTFTSNGTFTPSFSGNVEVLVVAGGGAGAIGGGGAGGLIYNASYAMSGGAISVTVGAGGAGGADPNPGANGNNSVFGTLTAVGGGGGGGRGTGSNGGSGGGGGIPSVGTVEYAGGTGTSGQGNNGGSGGQTFGCCYGGGGGGGAGAVGASRSGSAGGAGGAGLAYSITGTSVFYAGGGGGVNDGNTAGGSGGSGGGGAWNVAGTNGTGGGGGSNVASYKAGGSGIVIVRYTNRLIVSPEPSVLSVGAEQASTTTTTNSIGAYSFTYTPNASITSITSVNFTLNATDTDGITGTTASPQGAITVYPQIAVDGWASTTSACSGRVSKFNNSGALFLCANVTYGSSLGVGGESVRFTVYKNGINNEKSQNPVFNVTNTTAGYFKPAGESSFAWQYRKPVTINGSTSALSDYQTNLTVLWASGMNAAFGDLRFTYYNSTTGAEAAIPHWIESNVSGTNATVWIKANLTAGSNTIYMYYGNPSATSASNGNATFDFFDDFEDGTLNKWSLTGSPSVGASYAYAGSYGARAFGDGTNYIQKTLTTASTGVVEFNGKRVGQDFWGGISTDMRLLGAITNTNFAAWDTINHNTVALDSNWHKFKIVVGSAQTLFYLDNNNFYTGTYATSIQALRFYSANGVGGDGYFDNIFYRKYASPEPNVLSFGATEIPAVGLAYTSFTPNESSQYSLNVTAWNANINPSVTATASRAFEFGQLNVSSVSYDNVIYTTETSVISGFLRDFMNSSWLNNATATNITISATAGTFNANWTIVNSTGGFNFTYTPPALTSAGSATITINASYGNITGGWSGAISIYPSIGVNVTTNQSWYDIGQTINATATVFYGTSLDTSEAQVQFAVLKDGYRYPSNVTVNTSSWLPTSGSTVSYQYTFNESGKYYVTVTAKNPVVNPAATATAAKNYTAGRLNTTISLNNSVIYGNEAALVSGKVFDWLNEGWVRAPGSWWNTSWQSRKAITINGSSSSLTDYQTNLTILWVSGMNTTFGDLRFTYYNSTTGAEAAIPHWFENYTSGANATVWIKTNLTTGSNTIYMYYGNPSATYNNSLGGNSTFIFFDDFNDNTYSSKWETHTISYLVGASALTQEEANQVQRIYGGGTGGEYGKGFRTLQTFSSPFIYEFRRTYISITGNGAGSRTFGAMLLYDNDNNYAFFGGGMNYDNIQNKYAYTWRIAGAVDMNQSLPGTDDYGNNLWKLTYDGTTANFYSNGVFVGSKAITLSNIKVGSTTQSRLTPEQIDFRYDDLRVRSYASPEPSVLSTGSQETQAGATAYISATGGTILSNVSTNSTGGYSATYTPPQVTSIQTYTLTANATDADGLNSSTVSTQIKVYPAPSNLNASLYTDRTYYNIGENVSIGAVMRNNQSALFTGALIRAKVYRNDTGAPAGTLDLPERAGYFAGSYLGNFSTTGLTEGWHYINITSEANYNVALPGSGKLFYINPFRLNASLITPSCIPTDQAAQGETEYYNLEARNYTTQALIPGSISSYWNNSRGVQFAERLDANDGVPCSATHTVNIPSNLEEIPGGFSKARFNSTYGGNSARHDLDYMMRYPFWDSDITDTKFLEKRVRIELDNRYNAPVWNALVEITGAELQSAGVQLSTLVLNSTRAVDPRMNGTGANEIRGSALPYNITDSNFNGYIDTNDRIRFLVNLSENERATVYIYYTNLSSGFTYAGTSLSGAAYPYYAVKPLEEAPVLITSLRLDRQIYPRHPTVTLNYSVYTPNPSIPGGPPTTKTYLRCKIYSPNGSLEADTLNILIYNNSYANSISMATASGLFGEYTLTCTATDIIAGRLSTYDQKFLEEEIAATVNILPASLTTTSQTFSVSGNTTLASSRANLSGTFVNVSTLACEATWWRSLFGLGPNCERYQNSTSSGANGGYLTTVTMTIPSDAFTMDVLSNNTYTYTNGTFTASGQIYGANSTQYTVKYMAAVNAWLLADNNPYSPVSIMLQMNTTSTTQQGVNITYEIVNKTSGLSYANLSSDLVTLNTTGGGVNYFTKNWTVDYLPAGEYTLAVRLMQDAWVAGTDSATFYRMNMAHAVNATDTYTDRPVFLNGTIFWPNGTAADESLIINFKGADVNIPAQNIFSAQAYNGAFNTTAAVRVPDNSYTLRAASARIMGDNAAKGVSEQAGIKVRLRVLPNITANAASYKANTPVNLTLRANSTANWTVSPVAAFNITDRDTFAYAAYNATWNASLSGMVLFENRTRSYIWNTTNNPPGNYTVTSSIIDMYGQAAGAANTTVEIITTKTAAISSALGNTTYGMYENASVSGTINRTGNVQFGGNLTMYVKNQNAGTVCSYCSCGTTYYVAVDDAKTTPVSFSYVWNTSSYLAGNYTLVSNFSWVDEDGITRSIVSQNNFTISIVRTADVSVTTSNTTYALTAPAFNITATVVNKGNWFTGSGAGGGVLSVKAIDLAGNDDSPTNEVYPSGPWYNTAIPTVCNYNSALYNYTWGTWTYNNNVLNFKPNGLSYVFRKMRETDNYTIRANYTFEGGSVFSGTKNITVTQSAAVTMPPQFYLSLKSDPYTSDTNPASRFANEDMWFGLIVTNEGNVQMQNLTANFTVGCSSPSATLGPYSTKTMLNIDDTNVYMLYENASKAWNTLQTPVNGVQNPCVVNVLLYTPVIYGGCPQVSGTNCVWFDSMTYVPSQTKNLNIKKTEAMYFNVSINNNTFTSANADAVVSGTVKNSGNVVLNGTVSGNIYNLGGSLVASMSCTPLGTISLALAVPQAVNCTWNTGLTEAVNYTANITYNWGTGSNKTGIPFSISAIKRASVYVAANSSAHNQSADVAISGNISNIGNYNATGNLTVRLMQGAAVIEAINTTNNIALGVAGAFNFTSALNTKSYPYGQYNITATYTYLNENGNATNATGNYLLTINENRSIYLAMSTNSDSYKANQGVNITVNLNNTGNAVLYSTTLVYNIMQGATVIAAYTDSIGTVSIGSAYARNWVWNTSRYAPGTYTVNVTASDSSPKSWMSSKSIQINATKTAGIGGLAVDIMPPSNYSLGQTVYVYGTVNATGNVGFTGNLSIRYYNKRLGADKWYNNYTGIDITTPYNIYPSAAASATTVDIGVINLTATFTWIDEDNIARTAWSNVTFYIGGTSVSVSTGATNTYNPDDAVPLLVHVAGMNGNITGLTSGNFTITDGTNTYTPTMAAQGSGDYLFTFAKNAFGIGDYVIRATVTDPSTGVPGTGTANLYIRDHWITVRVNANSALASPEADASRGYDAAKSGQVLVAIVKRGGTLDSLSATSGSLVMKQKLSANRFNLVLTQGNINENIKDRIKLIDSGEFEKYASPSFGFALTNDYHVSVARKYDAIDIVGVDVGTFRPGMYNLVIKNDGASNGKTKIVISRR